MFFPGRRAKNIVVALGLAALGAIFLVNTPPSVRAAAGVPRILNHQGRLFDAAGNLLGGAGTAYCFRFSLYDDATVGGGDVKLWPAATSSVMTVTVRNGVFSVGVGDVAAGGDALDFNFQDNDAAYLQTEVATKAGTTCAPGDGAEVFETLNPRQRVMAAGFAINAATVGGFTPSQVASGSGIPVLSSGNLTLAGTNPQFNATSTNTLTLQGGTGTGNIQFFGAANFLTSTGTLTLAGTLNALNINQYLRTTSTPTFAGLTLSGFATGSVLYAGTAGAIAQSSGTFFWDTASSSLAIGTSTTAARLTAVGASTSSAAFALGAYDVQGAALFTVRDDGTIAIGKATASSTVNIGTGTGVDTINIGTGATGGDTITLGSTAAATHILLQSGEASAPFTLTASGVTTSTGLLVNATSLTSGEALRIVGPTSTLLTVGNATEGALDWARVTVGGTSTRDQFYVYGRINSSWQMAYQDFVGGSASIAADANYGNVTLDEDAECIWLSQDTAGASTIRARAGGAAATIGDGCNTGSGGIVGIRINENPVLEARVMVSATTDQFIRIGFTNAVLGADTVTDSTNGIYFRKKAASTTWEAVTRSASTETMYDTGIVVSNTALQTLRIEIDDGVATNVVRFFINGTLATTTTTNVPTVNMGWSVTNGISTATAVRDLIIDWIKVWHDDPPGGSSPGGSSTATFVPFQIVTGADLAEYYRSLGGRIEAGTLVRLVAPAGTTTLAAVEPTSLAYDPMALGIVSTEANITMGNPGDEGAVEVALAGRVPVRVTTHGGRDPIRVGDPLTPSDISGVAMRAAAPGWVVGTAMEDYAGSDEGRILVFVNRAWYGGEEYGVSTTTREFSFASALETLFGIARDTGAVLRDLGVAAAESIRAGFIAVERLFAEKITVLPGGTITVPRGENQIAGEGLIPAGAETTFIANALITERSKIFVVPNGLASVGLAVTEKIPGQGFRVSVPGVLGASLPFDWIIVQTVGDEPPPTVVAPVAPIVPPPPADAVHPSPTTSGIVPTVPPETSLPSQEASSSEVQSSPPMPPAAESPPPPIEPPLAPPVEESPTP